MRAWHVSPFVDAFAYHYSALWMFGLFLLVGPDPMPLFAVILTMNFVHRHVSLPYAYLDTEAFSRNPRRLVLVPLVLLPLFIFSTLNLDRTLLSVAGQRLRGEDIYRAVALVSFVWTMWHSYMQKYGIMRIYASKAAPAARAEMLPWVDRLLVTAWVPFLIVHTAPVNAELLLEKRPNTKPLLPLIEGLLQIESYLTWLALAYLVGIVGLFLRQEWRAHRLRCVSRLSMAAGTFLTSALIAIYPFEGFWAFVFSHAFEYVVFVYAFQQRRYTRSDVGPSWPRTFFSKPLLAYPLFLGGLAAFYFFAKYTGKLIFTGHEPRLLAGISLANWMAYYSAFQSLMHLDMDGFLWRLRDPATRRDVI